MIVRRLKVYLDQTTFNRSLAPGIIYILKVVVRGLGPANCSAKNIAISRARHTDVLYPWHLEYRNLEHRSHDHSAIPDQASHIPEICFGALDNLSTIMMFVGTLVVSGEGFESTAVSY